MGALGFASNARGVPVALRMNRQRRRRAARRRVRRFARRYLGLSCFILLATLLLSSSGYAELLTPKKGDSETIGTLLPDTTGDSPPDTPANEDISANGETVDELSDEKLAGHGVNELGDVIIIMYHDIQNYEGEWVRSRSNFREDLERFHNLGYSLISLNDYLSGKIDVPVGRTPLVLTFDDGTRGQFNMIEEDGEMVPDPDCAVGILLEFSREHPEFGHAATFFINSGNLFGDASRAKENLMFLVENGMEIGNHTRTHRNLALTTPDETAKEIGSLANEVREAIGYDLASLALPYGGYPRSDENILSGIWDGQEYTNKGVLLVGAEPAPSPFSKRFDPLAIPRVRGSQEELDKWLEEFERYPARRFVSDGQSGTVTVREGEDTGLDVDRTGTAIVRAYPLANSPDGL